MLFGFALVAASIAGIIFGIIKKNKLLIISSVILLVIVLAVWGYFYNNPY